MTETQQHAERAEGAALQKLLWRPIVDLEPDRLVHPPSWIEHIPFAFWLVDVLRPHTLVELGTHSGNSYAACAQAIQHLGLDTAAYAIDTWRGDPQAGFYDDSVFAEWKSYHDQRYSTFSTLIRSTFDEALVHFEDGIVDVLNIDGYHTAEAVSHDFETWLPKMSPRGVVLMHDINVRERDFGAWRVWQQIRGKYPTFEFLHGHGLGVVAVGANLTAELQWLVSNRLESTQVADVRAFFARAGKAVLARYRAQSAERELEVLQAEVRQVTALREAAAAANAKADAAEYARARVQESLDEVNAKIVGLRDELEAERLRASDLKREVARHDLARARLEVLIRLPAESLKAATLGLQNLRARTGSLGQALISSRRPSASRAARVRSTLSALGLMPSQIARRPRNLATALKLCANPKLLREAHLIAQSRLFDDDYYARHSPDVAATGASLLAHFVTAGGREGRAPHALFDAKWYLATYRDVAGTGANPLAHYLRSAVIEDRDPHPLFSSRYYRSQLGPGERVSISPLLHYVAHGAFEGRTPYPLFDPQYYVETHGAAMTGLDPLVHFLEAGAALNLNPHPLFDVAHYRSQRKGATQVHANPLIDYLLQGSSDGACPHPLFEPAFYRAHYPDVGAAGLEPLTHFVMLGGSEGRRSGTAFDSAWYLATNPDVRESQANPLVHFVRFGSNEWRNPSPQFDIVAYLSRYADVAGSGMNPLVHYITRGHAEGRTGLPIPDELELHGRSATSAAVLLRTTDLAAAPRADRVVVCLSHVMPFPPRAGNEYRIHRILRWLRQAGYTVIPLVSPTESRHPTPAEIRAAADEYNNMIVCSREGGLEYVLRDVPDVLRTLNGDATRRYSAILGEDMVVTDQQRELLRYDRTFCNDALIATLLRLESALGPYALLAEYIWMSRVLPLVSEGTLKIIDTIDVFSTRAEKVDRYGVSDLTVDEDDERMRLERANLILAIQDNERAVLESLVPAIPVITGGVDFDIVADPGTPTGSSVLCVASGNPMNRRGLQSFLRFAWPRVRELAPDAELKVAGAAGESILRPPPGVSILGIVEDLTPLYRECRVVINPAVAGTGLKIKTIEALSYLRPIVTWPNGVDGLSPEVADLCLIAKDWPGFAGLVVRALTGGPRQWFDERAQTILAEHGSARAVYAPLARELETFFSASRDRASDARRS